MVPEDNKFNHNPDFESIKHEQKKHKKIKFNDGEYEG